VNFPVRGLIASTLFLIVVGCETQKQRIPVQTLCLAGPVTGDSLGALRIRMSSDSVAARCPGTRDTVQIFSEGEPQRVLKVPAGADTVDAEITDGRVSRIRVYATRFATDDSIHVGTPVERFRDDTSAQVLMGEGQLFVLVPRHCGLSFGLTRGAFPRRGPFDRSALARVSPTTTVSEILILGCRR